jgi:hypothetical protein
MVAHAIDADSQEFTVALVELVLETGYGAELGGTDRREILRMRKQDRPSVADPLVEVDGPLIRNVIVILLEGLYAFDERVSRMFSGLMSRRTTSCWCA